MDIASALASRRIGSLRVTAAPDPMGGLVGVAIGMIAIGLP
jgi:hypothetical protein